MKTEIDLYLAEIGQSENTIDRYRRILVRLLADIPDLEKMDAADLRSWVGEQNWGNSSQCLALVATRGFLRWKFGENHPALRVKIKRLVPPPGRSLRLNQVQDLLASFNTATSIGRRDLAMCGLFLDTALRVSEMCRLELRYVDLKERRLDALVKGGIWGEGVFSPITATWVEAWLADREAVALPATKTLFVAMGGTRKVNDKYVCGTGYPLTREGMECQVGKWGDRIGVKLSPHDLRRTFGNQATRAGAPQKVAMVAGRWQSEAAFRRYTLQIEPEDIEPYSPIMWAMR